MFNYVSVELPASTLQFKRVFKVTYRQHNYEHDYARVYFRDWNAALSKSRPGSPIIIKLKNKEFFGYVHDVRGHQDSNSNFTEVGIIGASYVMRQGSQEVYKNVTADQVVVKIAKKYGFSYKVTPHPRVYPQISQAGLTDWELMVKLAKQCGYFLRAENTSIYFQPLTQDFEEYIYEAPIFAKNDAGFKSSVPLYSFKPLIGETLAHNGADKSAISIAGVDPETGKYFKYTKQRRSLPTRRNSQPELFDKHNTAVVANNYSTALQEAKSADEKSRFPYSAEAEVIGDTRLKPGHPVYIAGVGTEYSGYWTVLRVEHYVIEESLNAQRFTTKLLLGTDSLGETADPKYPITPPSRATRLISSRTRSTRVIPQTVLRSAGNQSKPKGAVSLVSRTNRANIASKHIRQNTWVSVHGNLNSRPQKPSMSPTIRAKVARNVAR